MPCYAPMAHALCLFMSAPQTSATRMCVRFKAALFPFFLLSENWNQFFHRDKVMHTSGNRQTTQAESSSEVVGAVADQHALYRASTESAAAKALLWPGYCRQ